MSRAEIIKSLLGFGINYLSNMSLNLSPKIINEIEDKISRARINTYKNNVKSPDKALNLYLWNSLISCAFIFPLHICEVVIRNAVAEALTNIYSDKWPWNNSFAISLPSWHRKNLEIAKNKFGVGDTNSIIPELKFSFWQNMFTVRYDNRIWNKNLLYVMPNLDNSQPISKLRYSVWSNIDHIRHLRNRVAHHEPIINRNLTSDYNTIIETIQFTSKDTAKLVENNQLVTTLIKNRPQV